MSIAESDVYVVTPSSGHPVRQQCSLIYLHGGAYVGEIEKQHSGLIAELAEQIGVRVYVPIYGLAPDHHVGEALELIQAVMARCAADGEIYLMSDSAVGGLALAGTRCWLDAGGRKPVGLTLIAPWLDINLDNPDIDDIEKSDPWLSRVGLKIWGRAWAAPVSTTDARVSPLNADFGDFPPIDLYVGDRDITVADCRLLCAKLPPGQLTYHEEHGAIHVYPLLPVPEGRAARVQMAEFIGRLL